MCPGALLLFRLLRVGTDRGRAAAWSPHRRRATAENRENKNRADGGQEDCSHNFDSQEDAATSVSHREFSGDGETLRQGAPADLAPLAYRYF